MLFKVYFVFNIENPFYILITVFSFVSSQDFKNSILMYCVWSDVHIYPIKSSFHGDSGLQYDNGALVSLPQTQKAPVVYKKRTPDILD